MGELQWDHENVVSGTRGDHWSVKHSMSDEVSQRKLDHHPDTLLCHMFWKTSIRDDVGITTASHTSCQAQAHLNAFAAVLAELIEHAIVQSMSQRSLSKTLAQERAF